MRIPEMIFKDGGYPLNQCKWWINVVSGIDVSLYFVCLKCGRSPS